MKWLAKHEPVLIAGVVIAAAVFLVLHFGAVHALGIVQGLATTLPVLIAGVARQFVTSPAGRQALTDAAGDISRLPQTISDVEGLRNDFESFKQQIGPLPKGGGVVGVAEWLKGEVQHHLADVAALGEAVKADIEDLLHQHVVSFDPPTTEAAPLTIAEPVQTLPEPASEPVAEVSTPTPEPASPLDATPTPGLDQAMADLAKLVP